MLQAVQFRGTAIQIAVVLTTTWAGAAARSQPAEGYPTAQREHAGPDKRCGRPERW
ncbi:MAG: hypothetical protein IH985_09585 [Planctomycetes bacterium]|nr:hypothetical protein [Planctomycetota bacterium]